MQHLLRIEKKMHHIFSDVENLIFSGRILLALNVRNTSWLKLIWFKFHEICVFYRKVIQLYVRCKKNATLSK